MRRLEFALHSLIGKFLLCTWPYTGHSKIRLADGPVIDGTKSKSDKNQGSFRLLKVMKKRIWNLKTSQGLIKEVT